MSWNDAHVHRGKKEMKIFNSFKATIRKLACLPIEDVTKLLKWQFWETSNLQLDNPNLLVAKAADTKGNAVAYMTAEPTFIISDYAKAPGVSQSDAAQAAFAIDAAFETEARKIGADRFVIVLPDGAPPERDELLLRVVYRNIPQKTTITCNDASTIEKRFSIDPQTNSVKFIN